MAHDQLSDGGVFMAEPGTLRHDVPLERALAEGPEGQADIDCSRVFIAARETHAKMLLSEENILGGTHRRGLFSRRGVLYPYAARRVRQVIAMSGEQEATLFLALRDPASFIQSAFSLQVLWGNEIGLDAYLNRRDPAEVRWSELVRRLSAIGAVGRIVVWRYEDYPALRTRLLARMLPPDLAELVPDPPAVNEGMTQRAYDWFLHRALKRGLADKGAEGAAELRGIAGRARRRFPREAGHAALQLLSPEVMARSAAVYADEIAALRDAPKVEFLSA